jgi:hypothetical protein
VRVSLWAVELQKIKVARLYAICMKYANQKAKKDAVARRVARHGIA